MSNKLKIALFIAFSRRQYFVQAVLRHKILSVTNSTFAETALEVFRYQYEQVEIYSQFCSLMKKRPDDVKSIMEIPFLPIELFKTHEVISKEKKDEKVFESSGTTKGSLSKHFVADLTLYEDSFTKCFQQFYGNPDTYVILALLSSYLERQNSSLVFMAEKIARLSGRKESGFFLNEFDKLYSELLLLKQVKQKTILLGVSFALLDFAERFRINFPELIVMETGGMKGRREDLTREEIHEKLCSAFGVVSIHSEYGMTELLSQAYSSGKGLFITPPWMKILIRDMYEPPHIEEGNKPGAVNIIDLANLYSCSFIATDDVGKLSDGGTFEIFGRMDSAELRGCNLLVG